MKRSFFLLPFFALVLQTAAAGLSDAKNVYLLPMANGLDQLLAVRLTQQGVLQVVTDPQKSDVVLTDHIGGDFEERMADLFGARKAENEKSDASPTFARVRSGTRSKGTAFLVNRKTGEVIWSAYLPPKSTNAKALRRSSEQISEELEKAIKGK